MLRTSYTTLVILEFLACLSDLIGLILYTDKRQHMSQ